MKKYLIKIKKGYDYNNLECLGRITYKDTQEDILFFKTEISKEGLESIDGIIKVEEVRSLRTFI